MSHRYNLLYAQCLLGLNLSWNAISSNLLMLLYHNWSACMMSKLSLHIKTIIIFNLYRQSTHSWTNFNFLLIKRPFFQSSSSPLLHSNKYKKLKYNNLLIRKKMTFCWRWALTLTQIRKRKKQSLLEKSIIIIFNNSLLLNTSWNRHINRHYIHT